MAHIQIESVTNEGRVIKTKAGDVDAILYFNEMTTQYQTLLENALLKKLKLIICIIAKLRGRQITRKIPISQAYYDVLKRLEWKSFVVLYDSIEGLVRLQTILKAKEWTFSVRQLNDGEDWR